MSESGTYHDGRTSQSHAVRVSVEAGVVHLRGDALDLAVPLDRVKLEPRLGDLPRRLDLPDGASCLVEAAFELPEVAGDAPARVERWVNELEIRWGPAIVAAALVVAGVWGGIVFGVPALARVVAARMHPSVERQMGAQALATLDRLALEPSQLPEARRAALAARFDTLARLAGGPYVLEFRRSPAVGPNAFALPGGSVVLLDELVAAAKHDDEIAAVLAHEIGHLVERHTMRHVLQTSVAGVVVAAVMGDVLSLSSYAAALTGVPARRALLARVRTRSRRLRPVVARPRRHRPRPLRALPHPHGTGASERRARLPLHAPARRRTRPRRRTLTDAAEGDRALRVGVAEACTSPRASDAVSRC